MSRRIRKVGHDAHVGRPKLEEPYRAALVKAMRRLFEELGTQEAAGAAVGVDQSHFGRYLSGKSEPSLPTVLLLADRLRVTQNHGR